MGIDYKKPNFIVVGIIGTRRRDSTEDYLLTKGVLDQVMRYHEIAGDRMVIVSGGCPKGGDRFAEKLAKEFGYPILIHYPNWARHGRGAGFVRNKKIADDADILIACVSNDRKGGTEDTIGKFGDKGPLYFV